MCRLRIFPQECLHVWVRSGDNLYTGYSDRDEILSVGDWQFQAKCHKRIQEMLEQGTTLLFVSHSMDQVKEVCNRAILLDNGHMIMDDKVEKVCDRFDKE